MLTDIQMDWRSARPSTMENEAEKRALPKTVTLVLVFRRHHRHLYCISEGEREKLLLQSRHKRTNEQTEKWWWKMCKLILATAAAVGGGKKNKKKNEKEGASNKRRLWGEMRRKSRSWVEGNSSCFSRCYGSLRIASLADFKLKKKWKLAWSPF